MLTPPWGRDHDPARLAVVVMTHSFTIARQVVSHSRQALTHDFISPDSNLSHSVAHALHASAHARQAWTMSGLWLAIRSADKSQNLAQSATRCRALACSFFPSATFV
jgi:hypothetical protein